MKPRKRWRWMPVVTASAALMLAGLLQAQVVPPGGAQGLGAGAAIVWDTDARGHTSEFIVRIAQFAPDRHFEWESRAQQGTIRIPGSVLQNGRTFTFSRLFDNGVDIERADFLTLWLSDRVYDELKKDKRSQVVIDALKGDLVVLESLDYPVKLDRAAASVPAFRVKDSRGGTWTFLDDRKNPLMLEYRNPYYVQKVRTITTGGVKLRWIK